MWIIEGIVCLNIPSKIETVWMNLPPPTLWGPLKSSSLYEMLFL